MGNYGMRNFQASDVGPAYGFRAYGRSRVVTCVAMVASSYAYLAWSAASVGYPAGKVAAVALMTLFKGVDAVEDVFDGNFQQQGRLDIAGKLMTGRVGSSIIVFACTVAATRDLVLATGFSFAWTLAFLVAGLALIRRREALPARCEDAPQQSPWGLLRECLPLFLAAFLLFYVGNAPKYAIDALMDDAAQAQYGFIAMPVFVVGLLAQFVYMPMVEPLSRLWGAGDRKSFVNGFGRQILIVAGITVVCVAGAWLLGVPVLGWLYNTDLSPYRAELCMLVLGGGFLALAQLFTMGITIMRRQSRLVWGYAAVAAAAAIISRPLVAAWGIMGASLAYIGCMVVLAAWFGVLFLRCSRAE